MFGIGTMELILIAVAILMFYGPDKLPDIMRKLGKAYVQMRRHSEDFRGSFNQMIREAEDELRMEEVKKIRAELEKLQSPSQMLQETAEKALADADRPHAEASPTSNEEDYQAHAGIQHSHAAGTETHQLRHPEDHPDFESVQHLPHGTEEPIAPGEISAPSPSQIPTKHQS